MEKGEAIPMANSDPKWQHLMQSKMELTSNTSLCDTYSCVLGQRSMQEPFLDLNSYSNFDTNKQDGECVNLFLDPGVVSLGSPCLAEDPRSFIDAWSKTVVDKSFSNYVNNKERSVSSIGKLLPPSLNLSMGGLGYNSINDEMGSSGYYEKTSNIFNSCHMPAYWVGSSSGGPLAEVLRPSSLTATPSAVSNQSSPVTGSGDIESLLATTRSSSPSMVLQKTLTSLSADSSDSSSSHTTFGSSKAKA